MKRVSALFVVLIFFGFLTGCGSHPSNEGDEAEYASGQTTTKTDNPRNDLLVTDTDLAQLDGDVRHHGGLVVRTGSHFFEILVKKDSVRLYAYDEEMDRVRLDGVLGRIQLQRRGRLSESIRLRFHPEKSVHTDEPDEGYLEAHLDFSGGLPEPGAVVLFHLTGIPGTDRHVYFSVPVGDED